MGEINPQFVPVTITINRTGEQLTMLGEQTVCPELVVVPLPADGRDTERFAVAHVPTGIYLIVPGLWDELTSDLARYVAVQLAGLDWTSPDPDTYRGDRLYANAVREALINAREVGEAYTGEEITEIVAHGETGGGIQ